MSENQHPPHQDPGDQERFGPRPGQGAPGEAAPAAPSAPSPGGRAEPSRGGAGTEDPQLRAARMRRRRRLLLLGAAPALLATAVALWCGAVFGLSMAASHALTRGDHETAVSRYRTVAAINPWLEQWRVHYNLGTALYVAADLDGAQAALETALGEVPIADEVDPGTGLKPEGSPECRVRHNLSLTHAARAAQAQESGDTAQADESAAAAQEALGQCPPPPSPDPSQSPSPDSSPQPSQTPSQGSSQDPSASPSPEPSQDPSAQPSQEPSAPPSQDPSSSPSASSSSSSSPSASASSSPDDRAERLRRRNNDESENGATRKGESQQPQDGTKPW